MVMWVERGVLSMRNYGHIALHLQERMEERGVNRNQLAKAIGTRFEVVDKWCQGDISRIDADILARLCYVLECDVDDLITYEKN